jgi:hypothetical protein
LKIFWEQVLLTIVIKMTELNKKELRKELIKIYGSFDKEDYNEKIIDRVTEIDRIYGGVTRLLDDDLGKAIYFLTFAIQKQLKGQEDKQKTIKRILEELRKNNL